MQSKGTKNGVVSLAFSSDFTKLELVWLNPQSGQIINAGFIPVEGIEVGTRAVLQPDSLSDAVHTLFQDLNIPKNMPISLMLPSFYTRMITLPPGLGQRDLENLLVSEAERSVLFKKDPPSIDWLFLDIEDPENEYCIYTAYPEAALNELFEVFRGLKLNINAVESNITSIIKGLLTTGTLQNDEQKRLIAILNQGNFTTIVLDGLSILSVVEVPVSLQSVNAEELIHDIQQDIAGLGDLLSGCTEVILVHNNSSVPTEALANSFSNFEEVILVEQSPYTIASLGANDPLYPCTVEALGVAMYHEMRQLPSFNLLPKVEQTNVIVQAARKKVLPFAVALNLVILALVGLVSGIMYIGNIAKGGELANLKKESQQLQGPAIPPEMYAEGLWLNRYDEFNTNVLKWMLSVEEHLPPSVWLQTLTFGHKEGSSAINLVGGSSQGKDISPFLQSIQPQFLKVEMVSSKVTPQKLAIDATLNAGEAKVAAANDGSEGSTINDAGIYYSWSAATPKVEEAAVAPAGAAPATPAATAPPAEMPPLE